MKKQIYDSNSIIWFESRKNNNGEISTIAIPFILNEDNSKLKNMLNNKLYTSPYWDVEKEIQADLNAQYGRATFIRAGHIDSLIVAINASSFIRTFLTDGEVCYKKYYTMDKVLKLTKLYEKAVNKLEKDEAIKESKRQESLKTRDF